MKKTVSMNDVFDEKEEVLYIRPYMFIKGYCIAKDLEQTLIALAIARKFHNGQYRKDGKTPYIVHPLKVCTTLIGYGIDDDIILAASLLHDIIEDCSDKLPLGGRELETEYGLDHEIIDIVKTLSKKSGMEQEELAIYFDEIKKNPKALLIKLSDRLHNSSTLYNFSFPKMREYIEETKNFIIPMASYGKAYYPKYTNALSILKNNISSLNTSMEIMLNKFEEYIEESNNQQGN